MLFANSLKKEKAIIEFKVNKNQISLSDHLKAPFHSVIPGCSLYTSFPFARWQSTALPSWHPKLERIPAEHTPGVICTAGSPRLIVQS